MVYGMVLPTLIEDMDGFEYWFRWVTLMGGEHGATVGASWLDREFEILIYVQKFDIFQTYLEKINSALNVRLSFDRTKQNMFWISG